MSRICLTNRPVLPLRTTLKLRLRRLALDYRLPAPQRSHSRRAGPDPTENAPGWRRSDACAHRIGHAPTCSSETRSDAFRCAALPRNGGKRGGVTPHSLPMGAMRRARMLLAYWHWTPVQTGLHSRRAETPRGSPRHGKRLLAGPGTCWLGTAGNRTLGMRNDPGQNAVGAGQNGLTGQHTDW